MIDNQLCHNMKQIMIDTDFYLLIYLLMENQYQ